MSRIQIILCTLLMTCDSSVFAQNSKDTDAPGNMPRTAPTRIHRPGAQSSDSFSSSSPAPSSSSSLPSHSSSSEKSNRSSVVPHKSLTTAQDFLERGKQFSRKGIYKEAVDFFTRATNADPNLVEAYNRRARAEWQLEQNKEALEDANWAIKLNPDYAEAFCTRAAIHNSMGQYQETIADASMARDLNPLLGDAYILEAAAYRSLNQFAESEAALAKLKSISDPLGAFEEWHPNIDYTPYFTYLQMSVQQHWHPPSNPFGSVVPIFRIHRSGQISDLRLSNSTGNQSADNAALQAVKSAVPFRQPPAGSPPDFTVYVVLDGPPPQQSASPSPTQQNSPPPPQQSRAGAVDWSGTLNTGLQHGLNLMQRFIPR